MSAVRKPNKAPVNKPRKSAWGLPGAILFGGMAVLIAYVVFFAPEEGMLSGFRNVIQGLFGHLMVVAPLIMIWLCVLSACSAVGRRVAMWRVLANMGLILCLFSAVELFTLNSVEKANYVILSWADFVVKAFRFGRGGGAAGALLAAAIYPYLGAWGGLIAVIVLATLLMAATGKLSKIAGFVQKSSHNAGQRRLERRSEAMFDADERTLLDREFDEPAPRRSRTAPMPDRRAEAPVRTSRTVEPVSDRAPRASRGVETPAVSRRSRLYKEDITMADGGKDASETAFRTAAKPVKVRTSKEEQAAKEKELEALFSVPGEPEEPAAVESAVEASDEIVIEEPVKPARKAKSEKKTAREEKKAVSMDELRIEPDEYETPDEEPDKVFRPDKPLPRLKRSQAKFEEEDEEDVYNYPPIDILAEGDLKAAVADANADMQKAELLEDTLRSFGIQTKLTGIAHGPAVTRFELQPAPGVKVSRITSLADDIALNLAAISVRIEAPIPGKAAVGVEVPNDKIETVALRSVLESGDARKHASRVAVGLGKDNSGRYIVADIAKMPHVLIAGQTGSGKSVCINSIIVSILFRATPDEVKLILIDPKVVELSVYNGIPHLIAPVVTDPKKAASALEWAVVEMTSRYKKFAERGVRDIKGYNKALQDGEKPMPHMVIIIDELADLMMVCPGEVEDSICRLAQLARAAGMHLVIATQRPSVNVITGIIKANIPTRIAFLVASQVDSRTIIDHGGAEKLLGHGDMLYVPSGIQKPMRVQGSWVSDEEVHAVVEYIKERHESAYDEDVLEHINNATVPDADKEKTADECDARLAEAIEIVLEAGQASVSMLQRRMRVGYARAGRLIDEMYQRGIVSDADGAKPRAVLITREQFNSMFDEDGE